MPPRSRNLWPPTLITTTAPVRLYIAPAGFYVIVHSVRVVNIGSIDRSFRLSLSPDASETALFWDAVLFAHEVMVDPTWHVLPDAAELWFQASAVDVLVVTGSGAILGP